MTTTRVIETHGAADFGADGRRRVPGAGRPAASWHLPTLRPARRTELPNPYRGTWALDELDGGLLYTGPVRASEDGTHAYPLRVDGQPDTRLRLRWCTKETHRLTDWPGRERRIRFELSVPVTSSAGEVRRDVLPFVLSVAAADVESSRCLNVEGRLADGRFVTASVPLAQWRGRDLVRATHEPVAALSAQTVAPAAPGAPVHSDPAAAHALAAVASDSRAAARAIETAAAALAQAAAPALDVKRIEFDDGRTAVVTTQRTQSQDVKHVKYSNGRKATITAERPSPVT